MGKNNIEKFSFGYFLLKTFASFWHNWIHYRKVIVIGKENLQNKHPKIFAPNHQNALMDAMAVLCTQKGQLVFLARADIFKKKLIASILYFFKILPIYRIRDGYDSLKNNDKVFEKTVDVIKNNRGLVILPEGNHSGFRRLRQLKKGIFRIALQTEEAEGFNLGINIIPVGVEYSDYHKFRSVLTIVYGEPINIAEYVEMYRENPQTAYNSLRDRLSDEIKKNMIHIESESDYTALNELRMLVNGKFSSSRNNPKIIRDKELIKKMEVAEKEQAGLYKQICERSLRIKKLTDELNIGLYHLNKFKPRLIYHFLTIIGLIALFPLFICGFALNYLFYKIPKLPLKNIKDMMFHQSIRYTFLLVLGVIFLPVYALLAFVFIPQWWLALLALTLIIPMGLFSWNYILMWKKLLEGIRVRKYINRKKPEYKLLRTEYSILMNDINKI